CACDRNGTVKCNRRTGECLCRQGVSGARCSECEPDRWGFGSAGGCRDCGCGNASLSSQCDRDTGLCQCRPGVTGDKCDRCLPGYYGYGPDGCTVHQLHRRELRRLRQCHGPVPVRRRVRGERCDICRRGWLNTPQGGCKVCDSCIFMLIDSTDSANSSLQRLRADQAAVLNGSELERLLVRIDSELQQFDAEAATLASEGGRDVGLGPVQEKLDQLRKRQEAEDAQTLALMKDQNDTRDQAEEALTSLQSLQNSSQLMDADATGALAPNSPQSPYEFGSKSASEGLSLPWNFGSSCGSSPDSTAKSLMVFNG
uniref:Laminin EGF-like domain-containing protein n=1 Tax=Macrostomum lignano TaxID=282301 RepID=A0A1I8I3Q4_9PLAT